MNFVQCKKNIIVLRLFLLTLLQDGFVVQNPLFDRYLFRLGSPPGQRCMGIPETLKVMDGLGGGSTPSHPGGKPPPHQAFSYFRGHRFFDQNYPSTPSVPKEFFLAGWVGGLSQTALKAFWGGVFAGLAMVLGCLTQPFHLSTYFHFLCLLECAVQQGFFFHPLKDRPCINIIQDKLNYFWVILGCFVLFCFVLGRLGAQSKTLGLQVSVF